MSVRSLLASLGLLAVIACTADESPKPSDENSPVCDTLQVSYDLNIQPIIASSCAYSGGCHPQFNSYAGMLPLLRSGAVKDRVINRRNDPTRGMPPDYAPEGRPKNLTPEQLVLMECWLNKGFPEK